MTIHLGTYISLGPEMPYQTAKHSMVGIGMFGKIVSIGGYNTHNLYNTPVDLIEMTCEAKKCSWSSMKQNMTQARHSFTSFLIPDVFVTCKKSKMNALLSKIK